MDDVTNVDTGQPVEVPADAPVDVTEGATAPEVDEPMFTVKVQGEELQVTQSELLNGYSRQADYTRKAQEVAEQRKSLEEAAAIQEALQRDPQWALNKIAEHYGVTSPLAAPTPQPVPATTPDPWDNDGGMDAESQRIQQLESEIAALRSSVDKSHVETQIQALERQDPNFDRDLLYSTALRHQVDDVGVAYKLMQADVLAEQARQREAAEAAAAQQKEAAAAVHSGPSRSTAASTQNQGMPADIWEAWSQSKN